MKRMIGMIIVACFCLFPALSMATDVGGIIDTDTTWDLAGSPYKLTSEIQISEGVTLTIEPGVEVYSGESENTIRLFGGSLSAVGTNSSEVSFYSITLQAYLDLEVMEIGFAKFSPHPEYGYNCQIYGKNFSLTNSRLENTDVYVRGSNSSVERNVFIDSRVIHQTSGEDVYVKNNVFYQPRKNHSFYMYTSGKPTIQFNSFLGTDFVHFELRVNVDNCVATENYWDTIDTSVIDSMIYDRNDDLNIDGYVTYTPFLTGRHFNTPQFVVADFVADTTSGVAPLTVNFSDKSGGTVNSWLWDFGDGKTSTGENPSHTYMDGGVYTVTLTVTGPGGSDIERKTDYIDVDYAVPNADFEADVVSGTYPLVVNFTDQSTGNITSWSWDFGDGETSTNQNPTYTYNGAGTYTVELTVTGPGGTDTETKTDYITVNHPAPVANFTANPITGMPPLIVNFTDQSTGNITSWSWDFGDGETSTNQNPTHTYDDSGTYTVNLTVTGPGGTDAETKADYIVVENIPLISNFTADTTSGFAPLTVNFSDESVGDITDWLWDFGDGETSTNQNSTHTYDDAGTYAVSLTVSGTGGSDSEIKGDYITVSEQDEDEDDDGGGGDRGGGGGCFISTPVLGISPISQHRGD